MVSRGAAVTLSLFAFVVIVEVVSSRSMFPVAEKRGACSKHTACRWAICPWSRKAASMFPDEDMCLVIDNDSCRCPAAHECTLTNIMEPGSSHIKFEYRCISPELVSDIYRMGN